MQGSVDDNNSFSSTRYYVPVLEIPDSPCQLPASVRSLPILADSQRSIRFDYENTDAGIASNITTARCHEMPINPEGERGKWTRNCSSWLVDLRWRYTRGFAAPLPLLTTYLGMKLGDVLITLPFIAMLFGYATKSAFHGEIQATGWPPTIALTFTLIFVVRNNAVLLLLTAISFERALYYHKICAVAAVFLAGIHGFEYFSVGNQPDKRAKALTGSLCLAAMVLLLVLSLNSVRRRYFGFFVRSHWLLFVIVLVYAVVHGATLILFGIAPWAVDLVYRIVYRTRVYPRGSPSGGFKRGKGGITSRNQVTMTKIADNILRIQFQRERVDTDEIFDYKAGQYVFLCVPEISLLEWHPFTISSSPTEKWVTFHIKVVEDWTNRLLRLTDGIEYDVPVDILLDGPYGGVAIDIYRPQTYSYFVFLAEGVGVLPMRSVITWLHDECCSTSRDDLKRVHFVWSVSDQEELRVLITDDQLENDSESLFYRRKPSFSGDLSGRFDLDYYLRQKESDINDLATDDLCGRVHYGALPEIHDPLRNMGSDAIQTGHNRVAVLVCGSDYFRIEAVAACMKLSKELKVCYDVHVERFEF